MRVLDLFCGAGGAAMGYHQAGHEVIGVDIQLQPNFPFEFYQADALEHPLDDFDFIHASPPCQRYMTGGVVNRFTRPALIEPVRLRLLESGIPFVIENVPGAPLRKDLVLCGSMFELQVRRHRIFEFHEPKDFPTPDCDHSRQIVGVYGHPHGSRGAWPGMLAGTLETWSAAMGIDWMKAKEITEAIPPAYTRFIGERI